MPPPIQCDRSAATPTVNEPRFATMQVCPDRRSGDKTKYKLTYSRDHVSVLCHAPGSLRVFVYDNEDALAIKLCSIKNDEGFEDFKFGVAVYDIDYDDHDNECASLNRFGRQSRLKQVKQTLDYMRLHQGKSFNMTACLDYQE
ncbi:hypothetical protein HPB52_018473 [Rhipicephalus sanguineus]|uniref:Uncharacterized protein n=1 Tax=Rhipicephalus sanguineus TaxID=34632 RepID=A0A9D4PJT7_RHISA|nr:hypothetical protein HPB52_018473 [Rhipicephalus sanguineus]